MNDENKRECAVATRFPGSALCSATSMAHLQLLRKNVWGGR